MTLKDRSRQATLSLVKKSLNKNRLICCWTVHKKLDLICNRKLILRALSTKCQLFRASPCRPLHIIRTISLFLSKLLSFQLKLTACLCLLRDLLQVTDTTKAAIETEVKKTLRNKKTFIRADQREDLYQKAVFLTSDLKRIASLCFIREVRTKNKKKSYKSLQNLLKFSKICNKTRQTL